MKDELPKNLYPNSPEIDHRSEQVLVCRNGESLAHSHYYQPALKKWFGYGLPTATGDITHWMPLPSPPAEKKPDLIDIETLKGTKTAIECSSSDECFRIYVLLHEAKPFFKKYAKHFFVFADKRDYQYTAPEGYTIIPSTKIK